jgi:transketolase
MTTLAGSGHPGGSMSSIDLLLTLYHFILIILKILIYQIEIE